MISADYLNNTPLEKAVAYYCEKLTEIGGTLKPTDHVIPAKSYGLRTAEAVYALRSVPHFLASAMDGIALKAVKTFGATETTPVRLKSDEFTVVDTGDPLPSDCDAVIMIEDIISPDNSGDIILEQSAVPWQHIRHIGEDFCAGDMLLTSETIVTPSAIGLMTAGGVRSVKVYRPLKAAIIPTGDEIVPADKEPAVGEITEYNGIILSNALNEIGIEPVLQPIVSDRPELLEEALAASLKQTDFVLLLAGSSAGRDDYSSKTIGKLGEVIIHGLAIKPGKPAVLGICSGKPVIGMPGYPVSALTVFENVILPLLNRLAVIKSPNYKMIEATLTRRLTSSLKYKEYLRVRLSNLNDSWLATPMERGAGMLASFFRADGILDLDQNCEGLEAGSKVIVRLMPSADIDIISSTINLIGSHDPLLDELADIAIKSGTRLTSAHTGSMGGLMALRRNEALIAPIHLLDRNSGEYNLPDISRMFPDNSVTLIEGFRRTQGLLLQRGNPKSIRQISDLTRSDISYVNRQQGAGTRILLDYLLDQGKFDCQDINGYSREELTHTAVAAQIAAGTADTGLAVMSVARLFDLEFLPITEERYDFAIKTEQLSNPLVKRFIELIRDKQILERLKKMNGYSWSEPGRIIEGDR